MEYADLFEDVTVEQVPHDEYHSAPGTVMSNSRMATLRANPQKYYQKHFSGEIANEDKECLYLGRVFHSAVLEDGDSVHNAIDAVRSVRIPGGGDPQANAMILHDQFSKVQEKMQNTVALFRQCGEPSRPCDFWDDGAPIWIQDVPEPTIVRKARWWGDLVGDRCWLVRPDKAGTEITASCAVKDMLYNGKHFVSIPEDVLNKSGGKSGKNWEEFRDSFDEGTVLLKKEQWIHLMGMRRELRAHPLVREWLFSPCENRVTEYSIRGRCALTGQLVQTRLDFGRRQLPVSLVADVKTARDVTERKWRRQAEADGLHIQAIIQTGMAAKAWDCEVVFRFIAVEKTPPYRVEVFELEPEFQDVGVKDFIAGMQLFRECIESGVWQPKGYGTIRRLETPYERQVESKLAFRDLDTSLAFQSDEDDDGGFGGEGFGETAGQDEAVW